MQRFSNWKIGFWAPGGYAPGFTLIELLIAIMATGLVIMAAYSSYEIQQKGMAVQREAARMEANLRAAMFMLKNDLRNSGRCGQMDESICGFEFITESGRYDVNSPGNADILNGVQGITIQMGQDLTGEFGGPPDGKADPGVFQTISYYVEDNNGTRELWRQVNAQGPSLIASGIHDMAIAFAFDDNPQDGDFDRGPPVISGTLGTIIWAVDGDNNGELDINLDNNSDRIIDERDDKDGNNMVDNSDGGITPVPIKKAQAARIWLLARSNRIYPDYSDGGTYQVGYRVFTPREDTQGNADQFRYLLLESSVHFRNRDRF